jgi:hypothetical protein
LRSICADWAALARTAAMRIFMLGPLRLARAGRSRKGREKRRGGAAAAVERDASRVLFFKKIVFVWSSFFLFEIVLYVLFFFLWLKR